MKPILILLGLPIFSFAQVRDSIAMKNANRIIAVTNRPAKENYQLLILTLKNNGYSLKEINGDSLTVLTAEQRGKSANVSYQLKGLAKENEIILSGTYSSRVESSISGADYRTFINEISNSGKKSSASKYAFNAMDELARQLPGKIFYAVQKAIKTSVF